ncbi:MAG: DUF456 domain-containing protein [Acidimicrobiia bacterium]|nr:DUF456 domain-containing protein [Acidimicrobiia bacterium]
MSDALITVIVLIAMLVGLAGTLVPILPGILLMWAAAVVYGVVVGFDAFGITILVLITALTGVAVAVGVLIPQRAAAESGAALASQIAAGVGAVIGFFLIPIIGAPVGAVVGIGLAEWYDKRDWPAAKASTIAIAKGFGISTLAQFGLGFVILLVWLPWAYAVNW